MSVSSRRVEITDYYRIPTDVWADPDFVRLSPRAQLVYFYARCGSGRSKFSLDEAEMKGLSLSPSDVAEAVAELSTSPFSRILERRNRRDIPAPVRREVMERDGCCRHCGAVDDLSIDHIVPFSRGGQDTVENLQVLCRPCNSKKGAKVE